MLGSKTTRAVVRKLSWGILGRGEGGLKGIVVSGCGYNEVPALGMLNVVDYVERGRCKMLLESASAPHPVVVALSFQAYLRACMRTSTCACVWTCMHTYAQVCMCACTCICACARVRVHAHSYACACMCTRMRRLRVLVTAPWRVWWCLWRAYAPMYMQRRVCALPAVSFTCTLEQVFWVLVHGRVCTLHRCVFTPTCTSVTHSLQVVHMCVYVYMCVHGCVCLWMRVCVYDIV